MLRKHEKRGRKNFFVKRIPANTYGRIIELEKPFVTLSVTILLDNDHRRMIKSLGEELLEKGYLHASRVSPTGSLSNKHGKHTLTMVRSGK